MARIRTNTPVRRLQRAYSQLYAINELRPALLQPGEFEKLDLYLKRRKGRLPAEPFIGGLEARLETIRGSAAWTGFVESQPPEVRLLPRYDDFVLNGANPAFITRCVHHYPLLRKEQDELERRLKQLDAARKRLNRIIEWLGETFGQGKLLGVRTLGARRQLAQICDIVNDRINLEPEKCDPEHWLAGAIADHLILTTSGYQDDRVEEFVNSVARSHRRPRITANAIKQYRHDNPTKRKRPAEKLRDVLISRVAPAPVPDANARLARRRSERPRRTT